MKNPPTMPHSMYKSNSLHNHIFKLYFDINAKTTEFFKKNNCTNITYTPIITPPQILATIPHFPKSNIPYTKKERAIYILSRLLKNVAKENVL